MEETIRVKLDDVMSRLIVDENGTFMELEKDVLVDWLKDVLDGLEVVDG